MSPAEETAQIRLSMEWKPTDKGNHPSKKPKEVVATTVKEKPAAIQVPPALRYGVGKDLMTAKGPVLEKHPFLLCEDSKHVIWILSSIIKDVDDYKDLGNHATEAMGELGLFGLAQVHNCPPPLPFSTTVISSNCLLTFCRGC